jgi:serine/threonine-protein kinase RCK2
VIHRDIKLENILFNPIPFLPSKQRPPTRLDDENKVDEGEFTAGIGSGSIGRIKIADFGLSKIIWDDHTRTPCGTAGYAAPEIVNAEPYSKPVDVWALGCVLYILLCGFPPFYDTSAEVLAEKVATGQYKFLSPWWDDISKSAQNLISHLLVVDPQKRYTLREFFSHPWICEDGPTLISEGSDILEGIQHAVDVSKLINGETCHNLHSPSSIGFHMSFSNGFVLPQQAGDRIKRDYVGFNYVGDAPQHLPDGNRKSNEVGEGLVAKNYNDNCEELDQRAVGQHITVAVEYSIQNGNIGDAEQCNIREKVMQKLSGSQHYPPPTTGVVRRHIRDFNGRARVFELNLGHATIFTRREIKSAPQVENGNDL